VPHCYKKKTWIRKQRKFFWGDRVCKRPNLGGGEGQKGGPLAAEVLNPLSRKELKTREVRGDGKEDAEEFARKKNHRGTPKKRSGKQRGRISLETTGKNLRRQGLVGEKRKG